MSPTDGGEGVGWPEILRSRGLLGAIESTILPRPTQENCGSCTDAECPRPHRKSESEPPAEFKFEAVSIDRSRCRPCQCPASRSPCLTRQC